MVQAKVRTSVDGSLRHTYDCVEVRARELSTLLRSMADEIDHVEQTGQGCVLTVSINEEFEPEYAATGYVWVADARPAGTRTLLVTDALDVDTLAQAQTQNVERLIAAYSSQSVG